MPLTAISVDRRHSVAAQQACIAITPLDGLHNGHRRVIAAAAAHAKRLNVPLAVLTFDPPLREESGSTDDRERLMSVGQQARALEDLGVEILYVASADLVGTDANAEAFASEVLAAQLKARHVTVGLETRPAADSLAAKLIRNSSGHPFSISMINGLPLNGSGFDPNLQAREALRAGRPEIAASILGRPFAIEGRVVEGQKLGRQLGYPTANVSAGRYVRPRLGAYATRTRLADGRELAGVSNFGVNPTTGVVDARLEVHLFDFNEDIYGQTIETEIVAFLRSEAKFDGLEELITQIGRDADAARLVLSDRPQLTAVASSGSERRGQA